MLDFPVYFLSWTAYGTWLPGDQRCWVDARDARPETPIKPPDRQRRRQAQDRMGGGPVALSMQDRAIAEGAIRAEIAFRKWRLLALNVRTNHVHVVLFAPDVRPDPCMMKLKMNASRALNKACAQCGRPQPPRWWTKNGSTRYLNAEEAVHAAIHYVLEMQDAPRPR